jgi:hypothetical protein
VKDNTKDHIILYICIALLLGCMIMLASRIGNVNTRIDNLDEYNAKWKCDHDYIFWYDCDDTALAGYHEYIGNTFINSENKTCAYSYKEKDDNCKTLVLIKEI